MTALFVNVSISANKSTGDASLFSLISEAKAECEATGTWEDMWNCTASGNNCLPAGSGDKCKP